MFPFQLKAEDRRALRALAYLAGWFLLVGTLGYAHQGGHVEADLVLYAVFVVPFGFVVLLAVWPEATEKEAHTDARDGGMRRREPR